LLNYIIIVSPHRSGGNLLIRLLDTHPKIFVNHTEQLFGIFINKEENSKFEQKLFKNKSLKNKSIKKKHRTYKINTGPINLNNLVVIQNELKQIKKFFFKNYLKLLNLKIKLIKFNDHL